MDEELTSQQKQAVKDRGGKLLVSAAAGSGKTKVLVDRLLMYLTDPVEPANMDDFLMITYTKAAAAELRGKIASKLNERLAEDPGNRHLQRQLQRLYLTKISTVHAFCGELLREYAYRLDIPGDFRVADEQESELLRLQVLDKLMEQLYETGEPEELSFIDAQELGRDDRSIPQIILQVYSSAQCHTDPEKWLEQCLQNADAQGVTDASETVWGQYLLQQLHSHLELQLQAITQCARLAEENGTMEKPATLLWKIADQLQALRQKTTWDEVVANKNVDFGRMTFAKNCTDEVLRDRIKAVRDNCKVQLAKKLKPFADPSEQVLRDLQGCAQAAHGLVKLVQRFSAAYSSAKAARRILDFGDLEHRTLDLLWGSSRTAPTALADEIGSRFREIMVDEYQDSNAVQDAIFSALTRQRQNCFMVGDVKQSIYQFRLADPGIFLEKYHSYVPAAEAAPMQGRKVMLSSNFRSAMPVIQAVNDVFCGCMSPEVGGLSYGEEEMLYEGVPHIAVPETEVELCAIAVEEDTYAEEAAYTARRIQELLDGTHMVRQKDTLRPITADDIVILLRSPGSVGEEFRCALESRGIRVNFGGGGDLLQTEEISFLYAMLQVIDNPLQDIPLLAVLSSRIFRFTADDLAALRVNSRGKPVYDSLRQSDMPKAQAFLETLRLLRTEARAGSLSGLIGQILVHTHMDSIFGAFDDGQVRTANLQAFYQLAADCENSGQRELTQFLDFLAAAEEKGLSSGNERKLAGAVTIMSIHKSKGLEFPVVFLCALSRDFNREDARAQVLCHKELGIGMNCVDQYRRVRYPSVAKKAIAAKMLSESLSEEMRVLYVAMTRARDRLIMTYASKTLQKELEALVGCMDICDRTLLTAGATCPGTWVLLTALQRTEAEPLFRLGGKPDCVSVRQLPWRVQVVEQVSAAPVGVQTPEELPEELPTEMDLRRLEDSLGYVYPHLAATAFPSKQTATQLKGREKDQEAAENAPPPKNRPHYWRKPSFAAESKKSGTAYGNAVHAVMQKIRFADCTSLAATEAALQALSGQLPADTLSAVEPTVLWRFFDTPLGRELQTAPSLLREFKFSVLDDGEKYAPGLQGEKILLQGVVDCAMIDRTGITVVDFKTDRVTEETAPAAAEQYRPQVEAYANALSQIFEKPVVSAQLYFFHLGKFFPIQ